MARVNARRDRAVFPRRPALKAELIKRPGSSRGPGAYAGFPKGSADDACQSPLKARTEARERPRWERFSLVKCCHDNAPPGASGRQLHLDPPSPAFRFLFNEPIKPFLLSRSA